MSKNTVYTVTPPDITMNTIGPSVMLLGISLKDNKDYTDIYEKLFPEVEITFFVSENGFTDDNAAWFRAVSGMASSIFVDLDNVTTEEFLIAMQAESTPSTLVFWISQQNSNPALIRLMNSYQYQIFSSVTEIEQYLTAEYNNRNS